jgi:Zn-dependent protease with chaperone function
MNPVMIAQHKALSVIVTSVLFITLLCLSLTSLCNWFVGWCMPMMEVKRAALLLGLTTVLAVLLVRSVWHTYRFAQQVTTAPQSAWPFFLTKLVVKCAIEPTSIVLLQSSRPFAFCFGIFKPRLCLSSGLVDLLSPLQLQAVLLHEDYHRRQHDPLCFLMLEAVASTLFFLPAVRESVAGIQTARELAADRYAIQKVGKHALAGALCQLLAAPPPPFPQRMMVGFSGTTLRIDALLSQRSRSSAFLWSRSSLLRSAGALIGLCLLFML